MATNNHINPTWITEPLSPADIAAVLQSGCDSGAYMPAVNYYQARETMNEHGDDVLDYLQDMTGQLPTPPTDTSWSQMACFYLSRAVELHCEINSDLADWEDDEPLRGAA
jgi:hypothetical protein